MRKLKLALILPMFQVALAVLLLEWGYRVPSPFPPGGDELYVPTQRMICFGINAPAYLTGLLAGLIPIPDISLLRLHTSDFEFLVALIMIWFLAGRFLDQFLSRQTREPVRTPLGMSLLNFFLVIIGGWVLFLGLGALHAPGRWNNYTGNIAEGILFIIWSVVLILIPGRRLINTIRQLRVARA